MISAGGFQRAFTTPPLRLHPGGPEHLFQQLFLLDVVTRAVDHEHPGMAAEEVRGQAHDVGFADLCDAQGDPVREEPALDRGGLLRRDLVVNEGAAVLRLVPRLEVLRIREVGLSLVVHHEPLEQLVE